MKTKKSIFAFLTFLIVFTALQAKILFIVDSEYYNDDSYKVKGKEKIDRYELEVETIDREDVDVIIFTVKDSCTVREMCKPVWDTLVARYSAAKGTSDPVEGAVLIGDIPEPLMFLDDRKKKGGDMYPVDYYYMDIWDGRSGHNHVYNSDTTIWNYPVYDKFLVIDNSVTPPDTTVDSTLLYNYDHYYKKTNGDSYMEIWVSRIYAKTLNYLRETGGVWGDKYFLDNHEIISRYLDRVHDRMTKRANVPPRAFAMGHIGDWYHTPGKAMMKLKEAIPFDSIDLVLMNYFIDTDTAAPENTPSNWQAMLQAGPLGNSNMGAFKGERFDSITNAQTNLYPQFKDVCTGYEWAGIFEHSGQQGHSFNEFKVALHGYFTSRNNVPLWTKISSGGYRGSYYQCRNRDKYLIDGRDKIARWVTDTIRHPGLYNFYMWFPKNPANDSLNYVNVIQQDTCTYPGIHYLVSCPVNMRGNDPGKWRLIGNSLDVLPGEVLTVFFNANHHSNEIVNDIAIADAIKFEYLGTGFDSIVVDNEYPGFIREDSLNRAYYSMLDDGGPSKVPFYILQTCHINCYTFDDNLGLLYAMGHNGLMSVGSSNPNGGIGEFSLFLGALGRGLTFGEAFLHMANDPSKAGVAGGDKFILCGAGTMKAQAYRDYVDTLSMDINFWNFNSDETWFVEQKVHFNRIPGSKDTVHCGASLSITSGDSIIIWPEFVAETGSEMELSIDPTLKVRR